MAGSLLTEWRSPFPIYTAFTGVSFVSMKEPLEKYYRRIFLDLSEEFSTVKIDKGRWDHGQSFDVMVTSAVLIYFKPSSDIIDNPV